MSRKHYEHKFEESIIAAVRNSKSMAEACRKLQMNHNTFKHHAIRLKIYKPNQSGMGTSKLSYATSKYPLFKVLSGEHRYNGTTFRLKNRMIKAGLLENICSTCSLKEWQGKSLPLELDHIDGNRNNNKFENLRILCPNCHSQTATYRGKNRKLKRGA